MRSLFKKTFGKYLFLTNTISSGVLLGFGDLIQQKIEKFRGTHVYEKKYDWMRTRRMFLVGLISGPPHHYWYIWLDRLLPGKSKRMIIYKILSDQLVAAPFFAVTFFLGMGLLEGRTLRSSMDEFKDKFPTVYAIDWLLWPPAQLVNFYYVPTVYRVLYVNLVTVVWDVILSYIKHHDQMKRMFVKAS